MEDALKSHFDCIAFLAPSAADLTLSFLEFNNRAIIGCNNYIQSFFKILTIKNKPVKKFSTGFKDQYFSEVFTINTDKQFIIFTHFQNACTYNSVSCRIVKGPDNAFWCLQ